MRITAIILLITLSGCSLFKKPCSNIERLTKKFPECYDAIKKPISVDTLLPEIKVVIEKELTIDSAANDSIMALLDSCKNSMTIEEKIVYRDKIKEIILNNLEIEPFDTTVDNLNLHISVVNGKIKLGFERPETKMTVTGETTALQPKPQGNNWKPIIVSAILLILLILGLIAVSKYLDYKKEKLKKENKSEKYIV